MILVMGDILANEKNDEYLLRDNDELKHVIQYILLGK